MRKKDHPTHEREERSIQREKYEPPRVTWDSIEDEGELLAACALDANTPACLRGGVSSA